MNLKQILQPDERNQRSISGNILGKLQDVAQRASETDFFLNKLRGKFFSMSVLSKVDWITNPNVQ